MNGWCVCVCVVPCKASIVQSLLAPEDYVQTPPQIIRLKVHDLQWGVKKKHSEAVGRVTWLKLMLCVCSSTCWNESSNSVWRDTVIFTWLARALDCEHRDMRLETIHTLGFMCVEELGECYLTQITEMSQFPPEASLVCNLWTFSAAQHTHTHIIRGKLRL